MAPVKKLTVSLLEIYVYKLEIQNFFKNKLTAERLRLHGACGVSNQAASNQTTSQTKSRPIRFFRLSSGVRRNAHKKETNVSGGENEAVSDCGCGSGNHMLVKQNRIISYMLPIFILVRTIS